MMTSKESSQDSTSAGFHAEALAVANGVERKPTIAQFPHVERQSVVTQHPVDESEQCMSDFPSCSRAMSSGVRRPATTMPGSGDTSHAVQSPMQEHPNDHRRHEPQGFHRADTEPRKRRSRAIPSEPPADAEQRGASQQTPVNVAQLG
jgi:hypothetical protein